VQQILQQMEVEVLVVEERPVPVRGLLPVLVRRGLLLLLPPGLGVPLLLVPMPLVPMPKCR